MNSAAIGQKTVSGRDVGALFVHRGIGTPGFTISHAASGLAVALEFAGEDDALRCAFILDREFAWDRIVADAAYRHLAIPAIRQIVAGLGGRAGGETDATRAAMSRAVAERASIPKDRLQ